MVYFYAKLTHLLIVFLNVNLAEYKVVQHVNDFYETKR